MENATICHRPPKSISLSAECILPLQKLTYLEKEIGYITATEGLALVTRSFILMYVIALSRNVLPELETTNEAIRMDPEVMTLNVEMNCRKKIPRNAKKPLMVMVWLEDDWSIQTRQERTVFRGTVRFKVEEGRWDGQIETFIWLE